MLGKQAAFRYYEWQFIGQVRAHHLGAWAGDDLVGFCICGEFHAALSGFLQRNKYFLTCCFIAKPWLLINPEIRTALQVAVRSLMRRRKHSPVTTAIPSFGILSLAVSPRSRRLGVGAQLMNKAEEIARIQGYRIMNLTVRPENQGAIEFYAKLGWHRDSAEAHWVGAMTKPLL
jgi:ribosomal protein S18 acetylase RimI-like enzyme